MPDYLESTPFTSQQEMEFLMSALGVSNRAADATDPAAVVAYYVSEGTSEVLAYCQHKGPVDKLAANPWVRQSATIAASLFLSGHGGEPENESLAASWKRRLELLSMVMANELDIPLLAATLTDYISGAPVVANVRVDPQMLPAIRVVRPASTDTPGAGVYQPVDWSSRWRRRT